MREYKTDKNHYTTREVMELVGKRRRSISTMIQDGRLPKPYKDGRLLVWDKKELDRWIERKKHLNFDR